MKQLTTIKILKLMQIFTLIGMLLSMYLWYVHVSSQIALCTSTCGSIITGDYGIFLGLPWGAWGLFYYLGFFAVLLLNSKFNDKINKIFIILGLSAGWIVSLYLRYLEFFKIHELCLYCWGSVVIIFVLTLLGIKYINKLSKGV